MAAKSATTSAGATVNLEKSAIDDLRSRLRGILLSAGDAGYEDARSVWNAMIDRRPALIARCLGGADIVACVNFARDRGIALSIKGGGHNIAGLAVCDGALMIDLSLMRGVWVDRAARVARAQGGCLLGDVDRETQVLRRTILRAQRIGIDREAGLKFKQFVLGERRLSRIARSHA